MVQIRTLASMSSRIVRVPLLGVVLLLAAAVASPAQITFTEYPGPTTPTFEDGYALVDIIAGRDGNLWFTEGYAFGAQTHIGRITPAGVLTLFPVPSRDTEGGITAGGDGNLWFTEYRTNKIGRITPTGVVTEFSIPFFAFPSDITWGPDGNLWITVGFGSASVGRFNPNTLQWKEFAVGGNQAQITTGPDGNVWFTKHVANKIGKITPDGVFTEFSVPTSGGYPIGITSGPDGNLWFTESSGNKIGKITTARRDHGIRDPDLRPQSKPHQRRAGR